jgi:hypothetical protein
MLQYTRAKPDTYICHRIAWARLSEAITSQDLAVEVGF